MDIAGDTGRLEKLSAVEMIALKAMWRSECAKTRPCYMFGKEYQLLKSCFDELPIAASRPGRRARSRARVASVTRISRNFGVQWRWRERLSRPSRSGRAGAA